MDQFYIAILSVLVMSIIWFIKVSFNPGRRTPPLPPGPRGLPILGYLPFLGKNLLHQFGDLARQYGPIYKLYLGNKLCVSPSLVKEVVRDQDSIFADRDANIAALTVTYGGNDIAFSPHNSRWRAMRKIFVREVLSSGSLQASYNLRKDEVRKAIRGVYNNIGKPVQVGELSFRTELNVIMNMLWGGIVEGEEGQKVGDEFREVVIKFVDLLGKPNIADFYPVLAGLIFKMLSREIKKEGKDFLQVLLELKENEDSEMSMSLTQIKALFVDIVAGGTDTTATTIEWAMAELLNNPKAMANVQNELSEMVGLNNEVEEFHIHKLKYLEAVMKETMRLHPAVPLLLPRSPTQTSTIGGYTVPKRTRVFINVGWIQRDPSIWDSPSEFKPERVCAGLPLAERMLMYVLSSLLHSFEWKLPDGETVDMSDKFGLVLRKSTPLLAIPSPRELPLLLDHRTSCMYTSVSVVV
ncbi:cytochrome [Sesamum angolense]|uniref:Cytochrome n=1 Tax=Sesamum angolense TaxID=2727404 RepID=A0AAE1WW99_9LAMI|nr:cytochrome [Sesamum angolense]